MSLSLSKGFVKGNRYNISVYPIYKYRLHGILHIQAGSPVTRAAYIQQECMYLKYVTNLIFTVKVNAVFS